MQNNSKWQERIPFIHKRTKEEWTTLLMCARENPELFPMKKPKKVKMYGIITGDEIKY